MTEQELNLFEFASGTVAEPSAGTTKIVWRQVIHSDLLAYPAVKQHPERSRLFSPVSPDSPEYQPF